MLKQLLTLLSGKKAVIATVLMGIVAYMATKNILGEAEVTLATLIIGTLFGTASIATGKLVYGKKK
ncbi:MAG: hypothetical protein H6743_03760 [Rickettsiaceae bacterium]|nr:hypothetical protein [Rickettsiaceae bacterium]